jgi:hypothetical protein
VKSELIQSYDQLINEATHDNFSPTYVFHHSEAGLLQAYAFALYVKGLRYDIKAFAALPREKNLSYPLDRRTNMDVVGREAWFTLNPLTLPSEISRLTLCIRKLSVF